MSHSIQCLATIHLNEETNVVTITIPRPESNVEKREIIDFISQSPHKVKGKAILDENKRNLIITLKPAARSTD